MKKSIILSGLLFFLLLIPEIFSASNRAPYINLYNNRNKRIKLFSKYKRIPNKKRKNYIISFWASYCAPCKKEMPVLIKFEKKYSKTKNLKLILINTDNNGTTHTAKDKADEALKKIDIKHEYLLDIYQIVLKSYNPKKSVPATFLINKNGIIKFRMIGFHKDTLTLLEDAIKNIR